MIHTSLASFIKFHALLSSAEDEIKSFDECDAVDAAFLLTH